MSSTSVSTPPPLLTALDVIQTALRRLGAERDVERLYAAAVREAATVFNVRQCALALSDAQSGTFRFHWPAIGLTKAQLQALSAIPADQIASFLTRWPEHGVIHLFDAEYVSLADPDLMRQLDERDVLLALVRAEGQPIGVLRLANKDDGTTFSSEDIHLLGLYASQLGLQIRDLQLLAQEQKARRLAETLLKVPQVVHQSVSPVMSHGDVVQDAAHPVVRQVLRQAQYTAHQPRSRGIEVTGNIPERTTFVSNDEDLRAELTRLLRLLNEVINYSSATVTLLENQRLRIIAGRGSTIAPDIIGYSWDASEDGKLLAMVESGQPLSIPDTYQDSRWVMFDGSENIRAWIGAPIWTPGSTRHERGDLIGVLNVDGDHVGAFTKVDIAVARSFADQMAIVLENQRLYLNMARRAAELAALRETSLAITAHRDLNELFNIIVERATALLNGEGGCIFQVDGSTSQVKIVAEFNIEPSLIGTTLKFGEGVAGVVAQTGQPQLVTDYENWPNRSPQFRCRRIGGLAEVPLRWQGRILGVLTVFGGQSDRRFTAEDLNLLALFADQAAIALENAHLFEQTQHHLQRAEQRSQELALINRISSSLSVSLDPDTISQNMVTDLAQALNVKQCALVLFDWQRGYGTVVAEYQHHPDRTGRDVRIPVAGNLSLARMLETKAPLAVRDAQHDPLMANVREVMVKRGVKSILLLPLIVRDEIIGTIGLDELEQMRDFTPAEIALAQTITNQAATAIANAQLYGDIKRRADWLQAVQEVMERISSVLDPEELLVQVTDLLVEWLGYYHVHIFLVDETGEYLVARGGSGAAGRQLVTAGMRLRIGPGSLCGWVADTGQVALVSDVSTDPRYLFHSLLPETRSEITVPMKLADKVVGVLDVQSEQLGAFDETDHLLLETLADRVAIALENARLYKALEERVSQLATANEDLKTLNRTKDRLMQMVSHELRTPLTFIKGYVELLLEESLGDLNGEQVEALQVVAQRTDSIIRLVNDILSLARAESMPPSFQLVDLTEIARTSVLAAQAVTNRANIHLETNLAAGLPLVWGDPQRLIQVFDNLIGNAIKFSPDGSTISVRLRPEDKVVRAEVSDHGSGIPADELEHIWEHFYQVNDGTTRSRSQGSGLGLTIVKQIVEAHGGQVGVNSVKGEGSTFYFTVPYADTSPPATSRDRKSS